LSTPTELAVILAIARNQVIGRDNQLPWRLSRDLQRFKQLTMGAPLIMGRLTFQSLGRFLPGRQHLVISRHTDHPDWWPTDTPPEQGQLFSSFTAAWEFALALQTPQVFAIGGRSVFAAALPLADRLHLTRVLADVPGDVQLPTIDPADWRLLNSEPHAKDATNQYDFVFEDYVRARSPVPVQPNGIC
jgi:dihydrofolate reductase